MICTYRRYVTLTGDTTSASAEVEQALTDAQGLLEDALSRPLDYATYTETLPLVPDPNTGWFMSFPTVFPVAYSSDGLFVQFDTIYGGSPISSPITPGDFLGIVPPTASLTYVAGFDGAQTDRTQRNFVPPSVERDIIWAAYHLLRPALALAVPVGMKSATSGDVSATFSGAQFPNTFGVNWSRQTMQWKRRTM